MSGDFSRTRALFSALCRVLSTAGFYVKELAKLQARLKLDPRPRGLSYVPPSEEGDDEESKQLDKQIRAAIPSHYRSWVHDFDTYHQLERALRQAIENAKVSAGEASIEIDGQSPQSPLDRKSAQIRLALQDLGGTVPPPFMVGFYPPESPEVGSLVMEQRAAIALWISRLRVLFHPVPLPETKPSRSRPRKAVPPMTTPGSAASGDASPSTSEPAAVRPQLSSWEQADDGLPPLRGWAEICEALERPNKKNIQQGLKRLNQSTRGPIVWMGNRPEVNRGRLNTWIWDTQGRADASEQVRASRKAAGKELAERKGIRQQDVGFHEERRPNARGKVRPAPEGP